MSFVMYWSTVFGVGVYMNGLISFVLALWDAMTCSVWCITESYDSRFMPVRHFIVSWEYKRNSIGSSRKIIFPHVHACLKCTSKLQWHRPTTGSWSQKKCSSTNTGYQTGGGTHSQMYILNKFFKTLDRPVFLTPQIPIALWKKIGKSTYSINSICVCKYLCIVFLML